MNHEALFWREYNKGVNCLLCPHLCLIQENQVGRCGVRKNINNKLFTLNYGKITSIALDPIEKKPLYHFYPGRNILSIGTYGCNMKCAFCQNYHISQKEPTTYNEPNDVLLDYIKTHDSIGLAFTYNEPLISYEYLYDTVVYIKEKQPDVNIVLVTNGFINTKPLLDILPYIDAFNIDLKAFTDSFYKRICQARLSPVLNTISNVYDKAHLEVTTLMVTDENDSVDEIRNIAKFLSDLDKNIPLHLSRYYPNYLMKKPATDIKKMYQGKEEAEKYLNYVYLGNIPSDINTYCPKCRSLVYDRIRNKGYLSDNKCSECGEKIKIIM